MVGKILRSYFLNRGRTFKLLISRIFSGEPCRIRTCDPLITRELLECPLPPGTLNLFAPAEKVRFPPDALQVRLLRARDFGIGLSSPSKGPRIALPDVLDQVRAKRDEAAPTVTACRRIEQPIAA